MSYYPDMSGLELFGTPFSTPTRPTPTRQQAKQSPPATAQQNASAAQPPKSPQPARQMAEQKTMADVHRALQEMLQSAELRGEQRARMMIAQNLHKLGVNTATIEEAVGCPVRTGKA